MASQISLSSTQTAIAIIAPTHLSEEIDSIRSLHDKAFGKWQPHINILYPFVPLESLNDAITIIRETLASEQTPKLKIEFDDIGIFKHRQNATVYLKPSVETEESLQQLSALLLSCLSTSKKFVSKNGSEYHPHLTLGQVNLNNDGELDYLNEKAQRLVTIKWDAEHLVVLKRNPSGKMVLVEELSIGNFDAQSKRPISSSTEEIQTHRQPLLKSKLSSSWRGWR